MSTTNFKVNTSDVLGFDYEAYIADVRAMALSNPSEYFKLRKIVMEKVRRDAVGSIYETFYNVLTNQCQGKKRLPSFIWQKKNWHKCGQHMADHKPKSQFGQTRK